MKLKISIFQKNLSVGDIKNNFISIKESYLKAVENNSDLFLTPELCITGYPPKDLLLRDDFFEQVVFYTGKIIKLTKKRKTVFVLGFPRKDSKGVFNSLMLIQNGKVISLVDKQILPNYGVFDEKRYFKKGVVKNGFFDYKKLKIKFLICEDFWDDNFIKKIKKKSVDLIIVTNASPYEKDKFDFRLKLAKRRTRDFNAPIIYINQIGGQDDLVFDGGSFCLNKQEEIIFQAPFFRESDESFFIDLKSNNLKDRKLENIKSKHVKEAHLYEALLTGFKDYVYKSGFSSVIIGISGGIDSALASVLACDAIGSLNVHGYFLPSKFSSKLSREDSGDLVKRLNMSLEEISIEELRNKYEKTLKESFKSYTKDVTEENIQSRIRSTILMALSNKFNSLLVSTGNKSELAVGYSTIYGDMSGAFSIIKDLYKTEVFGLSSWRNKNYTDLCLTKKKNLIPLSIIEKEPTAELRDDQKDSDSLPPYETLDKILYFLIDKNLGLKQIESMGFNKKLILHVWNLILKSEYKRFQSPPGTKLSSMSFGEDRRFPIMNKFNFKNFKC